MSKYVTYKRVSTKEQGRSGLGLGAQERDIRLFLENYADEGWDVIAELTEVYSGTDNHRPELSRNASEPSFLWPSWTDCPGAWCHESPWTSYLCFFCFFIGVPHWHRVAIAIGC